ncbi:hypothetical protein GGF46_000584 [Coemansia sp. RSA 552]|nr:hypothetical protein GGF46_000584 [Coemansia sp. RSA 552]
MSVTSSTGLHSPAASGDNSLADSGRDRASSSEADEAAPAKRFKGEDSSEAGESVPSAEHQGVRYYVGDHVELKDTDNISGTRGTGLKAVGQIQGIRAAGEAVQVVVAWYVYPQLTPHPAYLEFYTDTLLRTFRQTTVPIEQVLGRCYVLTPADFMEGRPSEHAGEKLYVCDSRYVDKGAYIQKIKNRRGFWPENMDEGRREMLTTMVAWEQGPRQLEKAAMPVKTENEADATPNTRRATRMATAMENGSPIPAQQQQQPQPQPPPLPLQLTSLAQLSQAQVAAYQQVLAQQSRVSLPPPFTPPTADPMSLLPQQQFSKGLVPPQSMMLTNSPVSTVPMLPPPPRRRGRPPKNKQLIQKRAMEDAAYAAAQAAAAQAAAAQQSAQMLSPPATAVPLRPAPYANIGRPPQTPTSSSMPGFSAVSAALSSPMQMHHQYHRQHTPHAARSMPILPSPMAQTRQPPPQPQPQPQPQPPAQQPPRPTAIPYPDASAEPQLAKDVVDMFPTVNGNIKWFAAPPVCQGSIPPNVHHSPAYLSWRKQGAPSRQ